MPNLEEWVKIKAVINIKNKIKKKAVTQLLWMYLYYVLKYYFVFMIFVVPEIEPRAYAGHMLDKHFTTELCLPGVSDFW